MPGMTHQESDNTQTGLFSGSESTSPTCFYVVVFTLLQMFLSLCSHFLLQTGSSLQNSTRQLKLAKMQDYQRSL